MTVPSDESPAAPVGQVPPPVDGGAQHPAPDAGAPARPEARSARSPLSDGEWHRMHPLSPLLRGGLFLLVIIGVIVANMRDQLVYLFVDGIAPPEIDTEGMHPDDPVGWVFERGLLGIAIGGAAVVLIVLVAIFYMSWRFHTFRITGDDVEVRSGVLFRTHRRAPLDRVQGVNLTRPMLARLLGLAKLEVVGAGLDSNVKLEYLSTANAEAVRADILRLASGRRLQAAQARDAAVPGRSRVASAASAVSAGITGIIDGAEEPVDEPESVVHIPVGRLIASHLLGGGTIGLIVVILAIVAGSIWGSPVVLLTMIPTLIAFAAVWVRSILRSLRYSIAPTPSGLRITFGLLTTVTEILPPGRVHAVAVRQPLLWRPFGWWTINVNRLSGRSSMDSGQGEQFSTVLPVGTLADAERVLRLLLPTLPEQTVAAAFADGILGPQSGRPDPFVVTPRRARWLRPLSWRRNGLLLAPDALLLRRGYLWRSLTLAPLARMQSLDLAQGPLARALSVAGVHAHTITGRVSCHVGALDRDDVLRAFDATAAAVIAAAEADHSHRWAGDEPDDEPIEPGATVPPPPYVPPTAAAPGAMVPPPYIPPTVAAPGAMVPPPPYVPPTPTTPAPTTPAPTTPEGHGDGA